MGDPYKTPQSDIQLNEPTPKLWWKVFFWFILILDVMVVILLVRDPSETATDIASHLGISSVILLGVFGYSHNKQIFTKKFWPWIIPVGIVNDLYGFYEFEWTYNTAEKQFIAFAFIVIVVILPMYFQYLALYRYGLKSKEIW